MLGFSQTRKWVYEQAVDGHYQRLRRWTFAALHLVLFVTPWVVINGHPALLFDLPARRLFAFGTAFTASDTIFLLLLLLFLAFTLFVSTALWGRIWCGYACPQTVFLEIWVRPIERWIEGEWTTRRRRDAAGFSWDRAWRKVAKWTLFAAAAVVVSMAFMSYFAGARELWSGRAGPVEYTLVGIFAAAWFLDFAWFREQFCNYLCPYARFQSVLTDAETITVFYDHRRGEPRGGRDAKTEGRCIDCGKCVNVCPQGIDIRNGFQLECIACARCVDACTGVMSRFGHETLIAYGTLAALEGRTPRRLRPRTLAYAAILAALLGATATLLSVRLPFEASVARLPGSLFTVDPDGAVRNTFMLRLVNNAIGHEPLDVDVRIEGLPDAEVVASPPQLEPLQDEIVPFVVRVPAGALTERTVPFRVRVATPLGERVLETTFKAGATLAAGGAGGE